MNLQEVYQKVRQISDFDPNAPPDDPRIDELLKRYLRNLRASLPKHSRGKVPGAAVMVRQGDKLVHLKGYGYANLETGEEITHNTIFDLGSVSKQFTAFAALSVFSEQDLDTPISKFFPGFPRYADGIAIRHLIHHTSALPDYIDIHVASRRAAENWYDRVMARPDDWYPQMLRRRKAKELTNRDVLRLIGAQKLLPRKPNTEFEYSNSGYVLLAELVRRVTKTRLAQFLKQRVFNAVGMQSTYVFDETSAFTKHAPEVVNHAKCYNPVKGKGYVPVGYSPLNFVYGDGNVHSTIVDMAKWDAHLTLLDYMTVCATEATGDKRALMARNALWSPTQLKHHKQVNYGAGWNLLRNNYKDRVKINGRQVIRNFSSRAEYHRGEWLGWRSYIARAQKWVAPEGGKDVNPETWESLGIIVLTNNTVLARHSQFYACTLAQDIARLYWGDFKKDNIMNRVNCGV
jgi:CubicO group peptidase (beta-lactamase class C family)